jgi:hypothetical protein
MSDLAKRKSTPLCKLGCFQAAVGGQCREDVLREDESVGILAPEFESTDSKEGAERVFNQKSAELC